MNGGTEMDVREKLVEMLAEYFNIGDSYAYNLTRVKSAFACGTVGLDDFEEFHDETVEDIASYLIGNGVTVQMEAKLYWKLVKPGEWNLTCSACDSHLGCRENANFCPECGAKFVYPKAVTPKQTKGE